MIATWRRGRQIKYHIELYRREKQKDGTGWGEGRTARDRGINNTSAQSIPVVAWGN